MESVHSSQNVAQLWAQFQDHFAGLGWLSKGVNDLHPKDSKTEQTTTGQNARQTLVMTRWFWRFKINHQSGEWRDCSPSPAPPPARSVCLSVFPLPPCLPSPSCSCLSFPLSLSPSLRSTSLSFLMPARHQQLSGFRQSAFRCPPRVLFWLQ